MLLQALCIVSKPLVNSSLNYSPETVNSGQNLHFLSRVTLKFDRWPWKTIGHIFYAHAVSANRILWVYAGFWWYHGILVVHLQDSVGAFGAKWLTKWLHHAKAPPHRGVLRWEWGNKDVHLVTTFVFCHVSKCYLREILLTKIITSIRSIKLSGSHRTQNQTSEVRWAARSSGRWVVASMFA